MPADEKMQISKPVIITGIVHPLGSAGVGARSHGLWHLVFRLHSWREEDGLLRRSQLILRSREEMAQKELQAHMDRIHSYNIVRVLITLEDETSATYLKLLDDAVDSDTELKEIVSKLSKPRTYEHDLFGIFVFDRMLDRWEMTLRWLGQAVQLEIIGDESSNPEDDLFQTVTALWNHKDVWNQRILDYIVQELLPLKNNVWLDEDEVPLSPKEFKSRMSLESISIYRNGRFEFWYDDGDLFFGHTIWVAGDLYKGLTDTTIMG